MNLGNIKIGYRLGLGFGLVLIITGIIGFVANDDINKMWRITENMYRHPLTVSKAVRDIRTNIIAMHRSMKDVALAQDIVQVNQAELRVNEYERQVYKSFEIVFERFLGEMSDVQAAYDAFVNWKPIRDEVIQLQHIGKMDAAAAITTGKGAAHVAFLNEKIQIMIDFANQKGESFYKEAQIVKNETVNNSLILHAAVVLIGLIVAAFITHSITKPLFSMAEVSERLKNGELAARNTNITAEETGILAQSINELADSIEYQMFIRDGLKDISETFIESKNMEELGSNLVQRLTEYTGSQLCALYMLNKKQKIFEPFKSIGLQTDKLAVFDAGNFEGEFGQALFTKEISHFTNIPDSTIFLFKTVAGSVLPKEIINIPVLVKGDVAAIISLSSLQGYSKKILELLQQAKQSINTGFASMLAEEDVRYFAEELQTKNQELETLAAELIMRSEKLHEQNIKLEEQRKQVESANRLKSEFLSNMSHELRTPLNSILSLSNALKQQTVNKLSEEETGYLEIVERNGRQLLELINDILDLSKIESGQMEISLSTISLSDLIIDIAESIKPIAVDKGIDLKVNFAEGLPGITSDMFLVHRIFQNIIGNAVKFTEQGTVLITGQSQQNKVSIVVKDTGIGMVPENIDRIFEEFRQLDGATSRRFEGSGLGLAIAKQAAKLLCGDILVESEKNKGSTFTVILPVSFPETLQNSTGSTQRIPTEVETGISITNSKKKTIGLLLVEDQETAIIQLTDLLEQSGFNVDVTRSGQEAIEYCQKSIPDGIILDLKMSDIDGFKVLEEIHSRPEMKNIPVLILTARNLSKSDLQRLGTNNVRQLLQKGDIDKDKFLTKIELMLGLAGKPVKKVVGKPVSPGPIQNKKQKAANKDNLTILIVEDNPDNMTSIKAALPSEYAILEATNGQMGLNMIRECKPDLVLLDIMLPILDGMTVLKKVREDKNLLEIPIIAITAKAMKGDKEKILEVGFDDYIAKPFEIDILIRKIKTFLRSK